MDASKVLLTQVLENSHLQLHSKQFHQCQEILRLLSISLESFISMVLVSMGTLLTVLELLTKLKLVIREVLFHSQVLTISKVLVTNQLLVINLVLAASLVILTNKVL